MGTIWGRFGDALGPLWRCIEDALRTLWGRFGDVLGYFEDILEMHWGCFEDKMTELSVLLSDAHAKQIHLELSPFSVPFFI